MCIILKVCANRIASFNAVLLEFFNNSSMSNIKNVLGAKLLNKLILLLHLLIKVIICVF